MYSPLGIILSEERSVTTPTVDEIQSRIFITFEKRKHMLLPVFFDLLISKIFSDYHGEFFLVYFCHQVKKLMVQDQGDYAQSRERSVVKVQFASASSTSRMPRETPSKVRSSALSLSP